MTKEEAVERTKLTVGETGACHYAVRAGGSWSHSATLADLDSIFSHVPRQDIIECRPGGAVIFP